MLLVTCDTVTWKTPYLNSQRSTMAEFLEARILGMYGGIHSNAWSDNK